MGFEAVGITLPHNKLVGKYQGRKVLVVGSARCVWDDLSQFRHEIDVMTVNDMVIHLPGRVTHAYSNDAWRVPPMIQARRPKFVEQWGNPYGHSCNPHEGVYVWPWPGHGTSSLNAVYTALALGYDEVILAGVPLDDSGHYFDPPWVKTNFTQEVKETESGPRYWEMAAKKVFDGKVKSLSGRTRDLLGAP